MPVYMVIEISVTDRAMYGEYMDRVPAIVEMYGGRYLVRGGPVVSLAGGWEPEKIVILEFPSQERLQEWNSSPEYQEIVHLRVNATDSRSIVLEGYSQDEHHRLPE